jgi:hypothetical protein
MKQMFELSDLATTLALNHGAKADFVLPSPSILMAEDAQIVIPGRDAMPATGTGHGQIATYTAIPAAYYNRMRADAPGLLAQNVNRWMGDHGDERRMVRTLNGNVRALLSDRYQRIDNYEVAEVALQMLQAVPGLRIVSTAVTESRLYIKAVSSDVVLPVPGSRRVGDFVEAGVMISNSEIGQGSVSIKPFAHFLVCTNGMVRDSVLRAAHVGRRVDANIEGLLSDGTKKLEDAAVLSKVRDVLRHAFDAAAFQRFIDGIGATTQQHITGDVVAAVEQLGPTLGLVATERSSIMRHLIAGGDLSRYGLANAVTRTAEDVDSYDRATEIETIGFRLLEAPAATWRQIAEARPTKEAATA